MDMDSLSKTPVEPIVSLFSITYEKLRCKRIVSIGRSAYLWRNGSITPLASLDAVAVGFALDALVIVALVMSLLFRLVRGIHRTVCALRRVPKKKREVRKVIPFAVRRMQPVPPKGSQVA